MCFISKNSFLYGGMHLLTAVTEILKWQCSGLSLFLLTCEYLQTITLVLHTNRPGMGLHTVIPASGIRLRQDSLEIKATMCNVVARRGVGGGRASISETKHLLIPRKTYFYRNGGHVQTYSRQYTSTE